MNASMIPSLVRLCICETDNQRTGLKGALPRIIAVQVTVTNYHITITMTITFFHFFA